MWTWRSTVSMLATVALCAGGCGKSEQTDDTAARAARPALADEDTATVPKTASGQEATEPVVSPPLQAGEGGEADSRASAPATSETAGGTDPAPVAGSQAAAPTRSSAASPPSPVPESTAPPVASPAPKPASTDIVDGGGEVAVTPTKPGLTRIGSTKCQPCHRVQFTSWSETGHAKRTPPLDCEACHGPGSEYKTMAIMKDPVQARAAGLVKPTKEFCVTCHRGTWSDDLLRRVHAHKPVTP